MSARGERTLIAHLVDHESLEAICREGVHPDVIPTPELRGVVDFAVNYFYRSGMAKAPSALLLREDYGGVLDDNEVDLEHEPEDTIEWALDDLRATYLYNKVGELNRRMAEAMATADKDARGGVVSDFATEMVRLSLTTERRSSQMDLREASTDAILRYQSRKENRGQFQGLGIGLEAVDEWTWGVRPGELAVVAAGPKVGKSFFQAWAALSEWKRGRSVGLFTLENSPEMMVDRLACMAAEVDASAFDRGECVEEEENRVAEWRDRMTESDTPLRIIQPEPGQRSFEHMVRQAMSLRCDSLLIDQLTFVEVSQGMGDRRPRHEQIGNALHNLKAMISTSRKPMPCLLTHQINREGVKAADKLGRLEMHHLAEAAEVERTADFVFGMYQSRDQKQLRHVTLQQLGARRTALKNWSLGWRPEIGLVNVRGEVDLDAVD